MAERCATTAKSITSWTEAAESSANPVSYTHLRAHETVLDLVCRLLLAKKKKTQKKKNNTDTLNVTTTKLTTLMLSASH